MPVVDPFTPVIAVQDLVWGRVGGRIRVEAAEYEGFFRTAYPLLARYAQRRFPPELAEELASAALLTIWTKDLVSPKDDAQWRALHAFAYRILDGHMKNASRSETVRGEALKRAHQQERSEPVLPDIADEVLSSTWPEWAKPLPLTDRDVLELVVDGYRVAEIAVILGCTPPAVSMRLRRAKKKALLLWERDVDRGRQ